MSLRNISYSPSPTSTNTFQLTSTDVPLTIEEGVALLTTDFTLPSFSDLGSLQVFTASANDAKLAAGGLVIVSGNSILVGLGGTVPTIANFISQLATATAVEDLGDVTSTVTGKTENHVQINVNATTNMQAGVKVVIAGTTNYDGTFYVESIGTTFITIESAFIAETLTTADTIKSPTVAVGIPVAAGENYELNSTNDVRTFRYVSAVSGVHGTMDIDLTFGG